MLTASRLAASLLLLFSVFHSSLLAQERAPESRTAPVVTAAASTTGVRFTAPGTYVGMHLEVYDEAGAELFDSGYRLGNLLDWNLEDRAGQRLAAGDYLYVLTVKSLSGRESRKPGGVSVAEKSVSLRPAEAARLSAAQKQVLDAAGDSSAPTVLRDDAVEPATVVAHDGRDGQVTSTSGALTFRTGDLFSGEDKEQMRVTPEGRVGIGTSDPQATLDVAGTVRARGGIEFADGTVLTSASQAKAPTAARASAGVAAEAAAGAPTSAATGAGTPDRLAKWVDGTGALGDSAVTESGGSVGIGTQSPATRLDVAGSDTSTVLGANFGQIPLILRNTSGAVKTYSGLLFYPDNAQGIAGVHGQLTSVAGSSRAGDLVFGTRSAGNFLYGERARITSQGDFGIGTSAPGARLEVAGNVKISGAGNGLMFPDGAVQTTAASGGAGGMTGTAIVSAINDPATAGTVSDARLSPNVARLNAANTFNGNQSVTGDLGVSHTLTTQNFVGSFIQGGSANFSFLSVDRGTFTVNNQRVGIGTASPNTELDVRGTVSAGGVAAGAISTGSISFPDGSAQTAAAGKTYTTLAGTDMEISPFGSPRVPVIALTLSPGNYLLTATVQFQNTANGVFQNNTRSVSCRIVPSNINEPTWVFRLGGAGSVMDQLPVTMSTVIALSPGSQPATTNVYCGAEDGGTDRSYVFVKLRRFTATKLENQIVTQ